ncbi:pre-mRNA-splicing factor SPF27 [Chloropicon primus]|uniref:Pre-mRNA-splicing factor SPF27 n=1 Tax=Chloropicon primus TaxID=1764295 RepID=A0A5B8MF67_9CHLO|nr:pre-mRNA-splicing factor SPF27 [Chloropicon primus]UPQ98334.1 pre-mRNA-splicing factor SPF27 [Chloropicon primus]|eukprot:QDZ19126.1 pre-mRNA-splicing factor SPF27 [Chloropicon primus]
MDGREEEVLIDSLPYADVLSPEYRRQAEALIEEEARRVPKPQQASPCGPPPTPSRSLDLSRYDLGEPSGKKAEPWLGAVNNASSQLEHQSVRVENLELMLKSGALVWRAANKQLEGLCSSVERETAELEEQVETLNRERKLLQQQQQQQLGRLEGEYYHSVYKNFEIEALNAAAAAGGGSRS